MMHWILDRKIIDTYLFFLKKKKKIIIIEKGNFYANKI